MTTLFPTFYRKRSQRSFSFFLFLSDDFLFFDTFHVLIAKISILFFLHLHSFVVVVRLIFSTVLSLVLISAHGARSTAVPLDHAHRSS